MADLQLTAGAAEAGGAPAALAGPQKSLLILLGLEESLATQVLGHLNVDEVDRLRQASETLTEVNPNSIIEVYREFVEIAQGDLPANLQGSSAYLRRLAGRALGEGRTAQLWEKRTTSSSAVASLANLDTSTVVAILENEHPQTLAVVLSLFDAEGASKVIEQFPSPKQADIIMRMSRLKSVPEEVLQEIEKQFAFEIEDLGRPDERDIKGIDSASKLLKKMPPDASADLIALVEGIDKKTADELRNSLFTFEDLMLVEDRSMQTLLKEVASDKLVIALKAASEDIRHKVFGNLSSRAATMLRDELNLLGPVRLADVEEAQRLVVDTALRMEQEGRIRISRGGDREYV